MASYVWFLLFHSMFYTLLYYITLPQSLETLEHLMFSHLTGNNAHSSLKITSLLFFVTQFVPSSYTIKVYYSYTHNYRSQSPRGTGILILFS